MAHQNFPDRVLYNMDNLDVLRGMNSETVDLIATDPPFNKKRNRAASASQYEDAWRWADDPTMLNRPDQWLWQPVHRIWLDQIQDENQALFQVIESTRMTQDNDTAAFLCFLGVRLLEMHRVLKPTGSIFLHCDHSANAYIRMVLDAIFGKRNFRNEVIWVYGKSARGAKAISRQLPRNHEIIYVYGKSPQARHNRISGEIRHPKSSLPSHIRIDNNGQAFKTAPRGDYTDASVARLESQGRIHRTASGNIRVKYLLETRGNDVIENVMLGDTWTDIADMMHAPRRERTGSPDQKPLALYERIVAAGSNPGDIVLDPFCGCATTPIAAQNLGRRWVGIDRREDAAYHVANRLLGLGINVDDFKAQQQSLMPQLQAACEIRYIPPARTDDGESAPHLGPVYRRRKPATMRRQEMLDILVEQWGVRCWGCGFEPPTAEFLELDHILPDSEGGSNELENRAPLCGPCNKRKSNTMTLTALRQDNRRNSRWYGDRAIDRRIELRIARQWATDYLAELARPKAPPLTSHS